LQASKYWLYGGFRGELILKGLWWQDKKPGEPEILYGGGKITSKRGGPHKRGDVSEKRTRPISNAIENSEALGTHQSNWGGGGGGGFE